MAMIKHPNQPTTTKDLLDEEALIEEARERARRRRHLRFRMVVVLFAVACLIAIGIVHYTSSPRKVNNGHSGTSTKALTCPGARVKLLGVSGISGGLGHDGLLVRESVSSSAACTMSGYPIVSEELTSHSTVMASDVRLGYLGGFANANAPLPRLSITSRYRVVSFTIQSAACDGPRPSTNAIQITLPGSRETLTARSQYESGFGVIRGFGIYCGHLFVTPLVKGSSGNGS
jgi:hypothetical protein